ncbi:hypothetical protein [Croceicoccus marinus]|uniref:Uncharacterized protein n=1 Tax=Croceicoccus marinus TaxID=450378 RepID=A0A1Z1F978_9SPHN|nr:hypothetical protein [Croceicoccus marinus]ARU15349.1 hypothetical protein A9D14_03090 [Croceicoccus marinus]
MDRGCCPPTGKPPANRRSTDPAGADRLVAPAAPGMAIGLALMAPACLTLLRGARAARCRSQARAYM